MLVLKCASIGQDAAAQVFLTLKATGSVAEAEKRASTRTRAKKTILVNDCMISFPAQ